MTREGLKKVFERVAPELKGVAIGVVLCPVLQGLHLKYVNPDQNVNWYLMTLVGAFIGGTIQHVRHDMRRHKARDQERSKEIIAEIQAVIDNTEQRMQGFDDAISQVFSKIDTLPALTDEARQAKIDIRVKFEELSELYKSPEQLVVKRFKQLIEMLENIDNDRWTYYRNLHGFLREVADTKADRLEKMEAVVVEIRDLAQRYGVNFEAERLEIQRRLVFIPSPPENKFIH